MLNKTKFGDLPPEIKFYIFSFLSNTDLSRVGKTSGVNHAIVDQIWLSKLKKDYGSIPPDTIPPSLYYKKLQDQENCLADHLVLLNDWVVNNKFSMPQEWENFFNKFLQTYDFTSTLFQEFIALNPEGCSFMNSLKQIFVNLIRNFFTNKKIELSLKIVMPEMGELSTEDTQDVIEKCQTTFDLFLATSLMLTNANHLFPLAMEKNLEAKTLKQEGETLLHQAIKLSKPEFVEQLIKYGYDVNKCLIVESGYFREPPHPLTPLDLALDTVNNGNLAAVTHVIKLLLENGADPDGRGRDMVLTPRAYCRQRMSEEELTDDVKDVLNLVVNAPSGLTRITEACKNAVINSARNATQAIQDEQRRRDSHSFIKR